MYFPQNISDLSHFLRQLEYNSDEQNVRYLDDIIREMRRMSRDGNNSIINILCQCRNAFEERINGDCSYSQHRKEIELYQQELEQHKGIIERLRKELGAKHSEFLKLKACIKPNVVSYKNLYIFILSHPKNSAIASAKILSRINYLDQMTRDVTFIMPGYNIAHDSDTTINKDDANMHLSFDENLFISIVQDLEDKSNGHFTYSDECELVFIGVDDLKQYNFDDFVRLNLDILDKKRGIDPIKLIITVANNFRKQESNVASVKELVNQTLGELATEDVPPKKQIFIAGSKELRTERALLREQLSIIANEKNADIRSLTFEDFATSLTGQENGRQTEYNKFIANEADVVVFVFDSAVGSITMQEFDVAYNSLTKKQHPQIFAFVKKRMWGLPNLLNNKLKVVKDVFVKYNKEYYVEYSNYDELKYLFYRSMSNFFENI